MKENELAQSFIEWYGSDDMYFEVPCNGIVDLVIKQDPVLIAIEFKMSLNFQVLNQAYKNSPYFNYSYIAVPKPRDSGFAEMICKKLGIGIFFYNKFYQNASGRYKHLLWNERVPAKLTRKGRCGKDKLKDYMKKSVPGSQNDRVTAFQNTVQEITARLRNSPQKSLHWKDVLNDVEHHYGTISTAKSSLRQWCNAGIIKDFTIDKGYFKLTPQP
jgi:hypothetical protein